MKKRSKKFISVLCAAIVGLSALAFSGCSSAYDVAVMNGFTGTEAEWLASLKGKDGKDGSDGDSLTIESLWEYVSEKNIYASEEEFIKALMESVNGNQNDTQTIAKCLASTVSVYCAFKMTSGYSPTYSGSIGSGVILELNQSAGSAYIVTNYHVIYDSESINHIADRIYVYPYGMLNNFSASTYSDESSDAIEASYVGGAMEYDIALLKVEDSDYIKNSEVLRAADVGDSETLAAGEKTYAVGDGNGLGLAVTDGILSVDMSTIALSAFDGSNRSLYFDVLRTSAAVNHGNSGGGLFDAYGKLIGITNAKNVEEDTEGICYALPITRVKSVLQNVWDNGGSLENGSAKVAQLGYSFAPSDSVAYWADDNGDGVGDRLAIKEELIIYSALNGVSSPFRNTGIKSGDVIQSIKIERNGKTVQEKEILRYYQVEDVMLNVRQGDTVEITVLRDDATNGNGKQEIQVSATYSKSTYFKSYLYYS